MFYSNVSKLTHTHAHTHCLSTLANPRIVARSLVDSRAGRQYSHLLPMVGSIPTSSPGANMSVCFRQTTVEPVDSVSGECTGSVVSGSVESLLFYWCRCLSRPPAASIMTSSLVCGSISCAPIMSAVHGATKQLLSTCPNTLLHTSFSS